MSNTCAKAQGRNIIFFHVGVISSKLTIPFKLKLFQTNSWWSYCQFNINFLSSFECISHKDKMFSYYGQRENFDYPGNTVVLDAKIKNLETSHINLDLWIFTKKNPAGSGKSASNLYKLRGSCGNFFPVFPTAGYPVWFTHWPYLAGSLRYFGVTSCL